MIAVPIKPILYIQERFRSDIDQQREDAISGLKKLLGGVDPKGKPYLESLIRFFENNKELLTTHPDQLLSLKPDEEIVECEVTMPNKRTGNHKIPIEKAIIEALGYKSLRKKFYPSYFAAVGIKACVYCNSQLTVSVGNRNDGFSGMFDVDHRHNKDKYPWLSICLFNLYPACAPCNRKKSTSAVDFELYSDNPAQLSKSEFLFKLDEFGKAKYLVNKDPSHLTANFSSLSSGNDEYARTFMINEIYTTQGDVIEELITKAQTYDDTYRRMLAKNFSKLGINPLMFQRIILGNYINQNEIHKRPMTKFMQDIAKEIGLM